MLDNRKQLRLHLDAEAELQSSVSFYRERGGEDLVVRFKSEVSKAFAAILDAPGLFPLLRDIPGVRRNRLKHFPFSILYLNRGDDIWVVAVAHGSRRPGYWAERLR